MNEFPTILQIVHIDETGDTCQRMKWPAEHLALQRPHWRIINMDFLHRDRVQMALEADLLVLFQSNDPELLGVVKKRKALGKKTLVEYNDNFYSPQAWSPIRKDWTNPFVWQSYEHFMTLADGILVTGQGLHDLFSKKFQTPVFILPNHYHDEMIPFGELQQKKGINEIRIGWAGSLGHMADLLSVTPLLRHLVDERENIFIHLMGNESIPSLIHFPEGRLRFTKWSSMENYFEFWQQVHIGIAPLIDSPYNRCRSDAKAMEMSASGVLPLLPNAFCYQRFIDETKIQPFKNQKDLLSRLQLLIREPHRIQSEAKICYEHIHTNRHHRVRSERAQLYEQFLSKKLNSSFSWPVAQGYSELKAEPFPSRWTTVLMSIQSLFREGKLGLALEQLRAVHPDYPLNADLEFLMLQAKTKLERQFSSESARALQKIHPLDLRFSLLEIQVASRDLRREAWIFFVSHIREQKKEVVDFFLQDIAKLLELDLRNFSWATAVAEDILKLFSVRPARILFALAEAYERADEFRKSQALMHELNEQKHLFNLNEPFLKGIEGYYLEAWDAALTERIQ